MFCFNVLAASFKAMVHGSLQADLMTMATGFYTCLHGEFSVDWMIHGILLEFVQRQVRYLDQNYASGRGWG